jgi:hypothetical protein
MSHNPFTLESLLADLEEKVLTKSASEEEPKEEEGKEDKECKNSDKKECTKEDVEKSEKDVEKSTEGKEEQVKEAQLAGAALYKEVMEKVASASASTTTTNKEPEMNKQAAVAGKALADALLQKLASAGDVSAENGIPEGTIPNKTSIDNAAIVAEDDAKINPMPTGDFISNTGTATQILDGIVADALAQGATAVDQVPQGTPAAATEGAAEEIATPNQVDAAEEAEKIAAINTLMGEYGYDIFTATDLVKSAAVAIEDEEDMQVKQAAFVSLVDRGIEPLFAQELVKSAGRAQAAFDAAKAGYATVVDSAKKIGASGIAKAKQVGARGVVKARQLGDAIEYQGKRVIDATKANAAKAKADALALRGNIPGNWTAAGQNALALAKNPLVYGTAGLAAAGGGAYALGKRAAFDVLVENGVDFEEAAILVSQKSHELFGQ